LAAAGIPLPKFRRKMHLAAEPEDFVVRHPHGPSTWVVLFRSVYSLVSFSAANVAACIAPSCRRFRARCGHVNLARPFNAARRADGAADLGKEQTGAASKPVRPPDPLVLQGGLPEEDEGIEKETCDTERSPADAAESAVAARVRRNLLPCTGEIEEGEVWARTADWKGMIGRCVRGGAVQVKAMCDLFDKCAQGGLVHEADRVLVEPYCGSCGCERQMSTDVTKEPAVLYTHHPTAPSMRVSAHSVSSSCIFWRLGDRILRRRRVWFLQWMHWSCGSSLTSVCTLDVPFCACSAPVFCDRCLSADGRATASGWLSTMALPTGFFACGAATSRGGG